MMKDIFKNRIERAMRDFVPTPEVVKKIIELNDGLYDRFKMAYSDLFKMKAIINEDILSRRLSSTGYVITLEYYFSYNYENGIPTVSKQMLSELSEETTHIMPSFTLYHDHCDYYTQDFEKGFLLEHPNNKNGNIGDLNLNGLEDHHIYMFMHRIFQQAGTFCVADIPFIKPEDLKWKINVQYEFFERKSEALRLISKQYAEDLVCRFTILSDYLRDW